MSLKITNLIFLFFLLLVNLNAYAENIYLSGFAFSGAFAQQENRYEYANKIINNNSEIFDKQITDLLQKNNFEINGNKILVEEILKDDGNVLSLAFSLSDEKIEEIKWNGDYLYIYRVIGQVLVFDYSNKKLISNYPVMVQMQDVSHVLRSKDEHQNVFEKIYLDKSFSGNIFNQWFEKLNKIQIKRSFSNYLGIEQIELEDEVITQIPSIYLENDLFKQQLAQTFEYQLSNHNEISLVPFRGGAAAGAKMLIRFADKSKQALGLTLPELDYKIKIKVRPFKLAEEESSGTYQTAYGSFITLMISGPLEVYADEKLRNISLIKSSKNQELKIDTWHMYENSLRELFSNTSKILSKYDKGINKSLSNNDLSKFVKTVNEKVFSQCKN